MSSPLQSRFLSTREVLGWNFFQKKHLPATQEERQDVGIKKLWNGCTDISGLINLTVVCLEGGQGQ